MYKKISICNINADLNLHHEIKEKVERCTDLTQICLFWFEFKTKHNSLIGTSTLVYKRLKFETSNFTPESDDWHAVLLIFVGFFCICIPFVLFELCLIQCISMWMWLFFPPGLKSLPKKKLIISPHCVTWRC